MVIFLYSFSDTLNPIEKEKKHHIFNNVYYLIKCHAHQIIIISHDNIGH